MSDLTFDVKGSATIVPAPKKEIPINTIVHVDYSIRPKYPDWMERVLHPELENTGLAEYDLAKQVLLWLHEQQKDGSVTTANVIYDFLKENDMLKTCLGFSDALAIQKLGVVTFEQVFSNNIIYFWRSVIQGRGTSYLSVPCLFVDVGKLVFGWGWLGNDWGGDSPAVCFANI